MMLNYRCGHLLATLSLISTDLQVV